MESFVCEQSGAGKKFDKLFTGSDRDTQSYAFKFSVEQLEPNN